MQIKDMTTEQLQNLNRNPPINRRTLRAFCLAF